MCVHMRFVYTVVISIQTLNKEHDQDLDQKLISESRIQNQAFPSHIPFQQTGQNKRWQGQRDCSNVLNPILPQTPHPTRRYRQGTAPGSWEQKAAIEHISVYTQRKRIGKVRETRTILFRIRGQSKHPSLYRRPKTAHFPV